MAKEKSKIKEKRLDFFFGKVGALTKVQRLLIYLVTFIIVAGGYYYFVFMPKHDELKRAHNNYKSQVARLSVYEKRASKILKYETLMAQRIGEFNLAMKALPDKREIPSLLTGISKAGSDAGLTFLLFQPANEINKEFFKEIPVSIKVQGRYHQITDFFFQIIRLNRIVNIKNVDLRSKKGGDLLEMGCRAVTYMFVEKKEPSNKNKQKKK
ncbi:type 4a pilus biogenesis protein PilO [Desulfobacula sp.]